jgi:nickel transport protein
LFLILIIPFVASAHRVILFAWVENNRVFTQSKFSAGKVVKQGSVSVYSPTGDLLLTGKTDRNGRWDFPLPGERSIKLVLNAGSGHRAEWELPIQQTHSTPPSTTHEDPQRNEVAQLITKDQTAPANLTADARLIKSIVENALDKKLKPVYSSLAESRVRGTSITDVLSGIGYILGLVGIGMAVKNRRRS